MPYLVLMSEIVEESYLRVIFYQDSPKDKQSLPSVNIKELFLALSHFLACFKQIV